MERRTLYSQVRLFKTEDDPALDQDRPLRILRPCPCGCDQRDGPMAGYLNVITDGIGMTVVFPDEESLQHASDALGLAVLA